MMRYSKMEKTMSKPTWILIQLEHASIASGFQVGGWPNMTLTNGHTWKFQVVTIAPALGFALCPGTEAAVWICLEVFERIEILRYIQVRYMPASHRD